MRPTRRGAAVGLATVGAFAVAALFGQSGLNAVAAPGVVALLVGAVAVWWGDSPDVERFVPAHGFPGDRRTMRLAVDAPGPTTLVDRLGPGMTPDESVHHVGGRRTDGPERVEYDVELRERGDHAVGPLTATVTDPLGLVARRYEYGSDDRVLVYPGVRSVVAGGPFAGLVRRAGIPDRQTFDSLREYVSGDALRDVHWKSSAKRGDLVVMSFASEDERAVTVVAEAAADASGRRADAMATAAASVVVHLLNAGVEVELVTPGGRLEAGVGERQRRAALKLLARTPPGHASGEAVEAADVRVSAADRTTVEVDGRRVAFETLVESAPADRRAGDREVAT
jgi:uncharacterized protein (DUF58 family)